MRAGPCAGSRIAVVPQLAFGTSEPDVGVVRAELVLVHAQRAADVWQHTRGRVRLAALLRSWPA